MRIGPFYHVQVVCCLDAGSPCSEHMSMHKRNFLPSGGRAVCDKGGVGRGLPASYIRAGLPWNMPLRSPLQAGKINVEQVGAPSSEEPTDLVCVFRRGITTQQGHLMFQGGHPCSKEFDYQHLPWSRVRVGNAHYQSQRVTGCSQMHLGKDMSCHALSLMYWIWIPILEAELTTNHEGALLLLLMCILDKD